MRAAIRRLLAEPTETRYPPVITDEQIRELRSHMAARINRGVDTRGDRRVWIAAVQALDLDLPWSTRGTARATCAAFLANDGAS